MGREKFNKTVTIDNEKALKNGHFLTLPRKNARECRCQNENVIGAIQKYGNKANTFQEPTEIRKFCCRRLSGRGLLAAILLSHSPIKDACVVGLFIRRHMCRTLPAL
jgi:hypothetical protein